LETPLKPAELYESLLYIGCKNAKGKTDVFDGIWQYFSTRSVRDKKEKPLSYYGDPFTAVTEAKGLLKDRVRQCGSFARLLLDILYAQGIDSKAGAGGGNYVLFYTKDTQPNDYRFGFLVKTWSFSSTQSSGG